VPQHLLNLLLPEAPLQVLLLHAGKHVVQEALLNAQLICACLQKHKGRWLLTSPCLYQWNVCATVWAMYTYRKTGVHECNVDCCADMLFLLKDLAVCSAENITLWATRYFTKVMRTI